ncbi:endo alpha-1,4 polygalactosaminidase [Anaerovibrio sp.]|uniref:endo alpha-1,4 polygalactosaminidase n=1 Tax=Anaerovibrio sp. TaxID=1872532 RepID=UPI003F18C2E2
MRKRINLVLLCACLGIFAAGLYGYHNVVRAQNEEREHVAYRQEMAKLIGSIKDYGSRARSGNFFVIANGGAGLLEACEFLPEKDYRQLLEHLDGVMAESVNYGWDMEMDNPMPEDEQENFHRLLHNGLAAGVVPMVLDYCREPAHVQTAYREDRYNGYLGWVSARRELDRLPRELPENDNDFSCRSLQEARNYLVLLNPENFSSREAYLQRLAASNYDLLIIDAYYGDEPLTRQEVARLQEKPMGGRRLVAAYMSVGEAEDYRPYWQAAWKDKPPGWLWEKNDDWEGNFRVRYWQKEWQDMLMGSPDSYLDMILSAGFDGAFLDVVDVFYEFEHLAK